ncbi:MAG: hypothetical protein KDC44_16115 [Phaeodactylibacter sp.]|nr:hypothetical protein [Phaeodactylibacter sp.]
MKASTPILRAYSPALLFCLFLISSCTTSTRIEVLQPAQMKLPEHIKTMATIDRSKPSSGFTTALEGLFTGEGIGQDRRGREQALTGLNSALSQTPRLELKPTYIELEGSRGGINMAPPLPWSEILAICESYGTDAVLAIESYDSDVSVRTNRYEEKYKDKDGKERLRYGWNADANANVKIGWRLYDPKNQVILDEHTTFASGSFSGDGSSERSALNDLPDMAYVVFDMSRDAGHQYGMRVAPVWVSIQRAYFTKGKKPYKADMQTAARYTQSGQWALAAEIWQQLVVSADRKTAGRAAYNLAVASEREDQLQRALEWADQAFLEFGNNNARTYSQVLRQRIAEAQQIEYQMN